MGIDEDWIEVLGRLGLLLRGEFRGLRPSFCQVTSYQRVSAQEVPRIGPWHRRYTAIDFATLVIPNAIPSRGRHRLPSPSPSTHKPPLSL